MRHYRIGAAVLTGICAAALAGTVASASPAAPARVGGREDPAATRTYVNENDGCSCREQTIETYRPAGRLYILRGGPNLWLRAGVRWTSWGQTSATGTGYLYGADAGVFYLGHVTVYFHDRTYSRTYREWYFARLHIIGGHNVGHYFHWSWAGQDWTG
jgi:hypothetical protein